MKASSFTFLCFMLAGVVMQSGCVTQLQSDISPGVRTADLKRIYVERLDKDSRGIDKLIADQLNLMGFKASNGLSSDVPPDADAVLTYQDKWMWDITMYMIQLDIQVRDPKTSIAIATGHSLRTSLARKSPPEMVKEVLTTMFH